jgi:hypothetical protein
VCKRLYAKIIQGELNTTNNNENTYEKIEHQNSEEIINNIKLFQESHQLKLKTEMLKLPPLHWTPKMHKNPVGSRFIIGSKMSCLKPLGKALTKIMKLIMKLKRSYYKKSSFYSQLNYFFPM